MKAVLIVLAGLAVGAGCATSGVGEGSATEPAPAETPASRASNSGADQSPAPPAVSLEGKAAGDQVDLVGKWQNGSCDKRQYVREIEFAGDGTFSAADLVSPCPPDVTCVWSGIIKWKGSWTEAGQEVQIDIEPIKMGRQPATLPSSFVILDRNPFSIGEKIDSTVCAYQRVK